MTPLAKTIQIYLLTGNPRGIRCAEMTTRTVRLVEIPRVHIKDFFVMPDARQVGLYFLVGIDENSSMPQLYIGQTGELKKRLDSHNNDKDFWERAFVMLSTNNSITQTHALYLEHKAIAIAKEVARYQVINGNNGSLPYTPDPLKADCEELFHTLSILLSTLGQPVFESFNSTTSIPTNQNKQPQFFYCQSNGANAKGYYDDDGFVVLANSLLRKTTLSSIGSWAANTRNRLLDTKKLIEYDEKSYRLVEDCLCKTPSGAADLVLGSSNNGWILWKNEQGETLDSIYR